MEKPVKLIEFLPFEEKKPTHAHIKELDLVVVRYGSEVSVLYGRCQHRGALMGDGYCNGNSIICKVHNWDYRFDTGVSEYNNEESLHKFSSKIEAGFVWVDEQEIDDYQKKYPQPFNRNEYLGNFQDTHPINTEPYNGYISKLAKYGLKRVGHHGPTAAMGVDRDSLPKWEDIQFLPAQLFRQPLLDNAEITTKVTIGINAKKPLTLEMPVFISDMSFGALSREAKIALAMGAEMAGTGIASGEGGMLPDEQQNNSKYFYELATGMFGFSWDKLEKVQAFHFKAGQGAKTGTGGHLPGNKVTKEIAEVRGLNEGQDAISPATFANLKTTADFAEFANKVRERTGGIPIGFKIAASHIEKDIDFALESGTDYIIIDGRGGGTGAAPTILRDNINVPTIPALVRARKHLNKRKATGVSLIVTGGLRIADDFAKALMLGADAVAISNSALQAIGCVAMRACNTNSCPVGVATQEENLRKRIVIRTSAKQLSNFLLATNNLMKVVARACGYNNFDQFNASDLTTFNRDIHFLTGINYAGTVSVEM